MPSNGQARITPATADEKREHVCARRDLVFAMKTPSIDRQGKYRNDHTDKAHFAIKMLVEKASRRGSCGRAKTTLRNGFRGECQRGKSVRHQIDP